MQKLGTWTTIDCPTAHIATAFAFLITRFDEINGSVRKVMNPHEQFDYPSFEIDMPTDIETLTFERENEEHDVSERQIALVDEWQDRANAIQRAYNKQFEQWL